MKGWKRWLIPGAALPFLALLAFGLTRNAREIPSPLPGQPAPEFRLATLSNPADSLALSDLQDRVVVLNFWASWCGPCRVEHPALVRTSERYGEDSVQVVGIVYQDAPENARRFMSQLGGDWPSLLDPATRTAIDFGVYGVPETYLLGPDGRVAYKHTGPVTWELLSSKVDSLLAAGRDRPSP
jgi:cytochrome c biogenesis protein CcmG/thiol:disulfide interchange protein DsbE